MPRLALLLTLASAGVCTAQLPVVGHIDLSAGSPCPIGIQAQPTPGLTQMVVHGTPPGDPNPQTSLTPQQSLRFLLTNPKALGIAGIELTVHGLQPGGHVEPVVSAQQGAGALDKHVQLDVVVAPGKRATHDVRFDGFTSVRSIDLESVTYSDGSTWRANADRPCRFEPSRVMLVAASN